ncbi:hypothetical protein ABT063_03855 [Streptomyces sp. NPDC002838]|uniref:hypothetical protein n=1 Tax=Streptomyces sp. NPDC002838 TaxID=3154436 RepID=UPI003331B6D8
MSGPTKPPAKNHRRHRPAPAVMPGVHGFGYLVAAVIWDASSVAALDAIETKYAGAGFVQTDDLDGLATLVRPLTTHPVAAAGT